MKVFCPMAQCECQEEKCILWAAFPAVNPQTGKTVINAKSGEVEIIGYGCTAYGKVLKAPKRTKEVEE